MQNDLNILILEDEQAAAELAISTLESAGYNCNWERVETRGDFVDRITSRKYSLVLSDYSLPQFDGLRACRCLKEHDSDTPFILVSGTAGEDAAVQSLQAGASDYVSKDKLFRLPFAVAKALKQKEDERKRRRSEELIKLSATALHSAANAIVITDASGGVTWVNPAFTALTGYSGAEALGRNIHLLTAEKHEVGFYQDLWKTLQNGEVWRGEKVSRRKDGSSYIEEETITPVLNEDGEITNFISIRLDVTESREAQEQAKQNERQIRDILDNILGHVVLLDTHGIVLEANRASLEAADIRREELIGTELADCDLWNYSPGVQKDLRTAIRNAAKGETISFELQARTTTRGIRDIFTTFSPLRDSKGKVAKVIGSGYDVTRRRRDDAERKATFNIIQEALRTPNLKEFYKRVHSEISGIVYAENCFVMLHDPLSNKTHLEFWVEKHDPLPPPELADRGFSGYVLRSGKPLLLTREIHDELVASGEAEVIGSDSPSWMGVPLRTTSGTIGALVVQHYEEEGVYTERDLEFLISVGDQIALAVERKRADEAVSRSEERYRELVENARDIIFTLDLQGNFTSLNKAVEELLGYPIGEALSLNARDIVAAEHWESAKKMLSLKLAGQETGTWELDVVTSDGRRLALDITTKLVLQNGEPAGMQGIARDVTARRLAREALAAANIRAIKDYEALLGRVASLALALGNARALPAIYDALLTFAKVSVPLDGLIVSLLDGNRGDSTVAYAWPSGRGFDVSGLPLMSSSETPHGRAVSSGEIVVTDDFQDAAYSLPDVGPWLRKGPDRPRSSLAIPMKLMGRVIGGLEVLSSKKAAYTAEHATAIQLAGNLIANTIENVRLLQSEADRAEQLRHSQRLESVGRLAGGIAHDFNNLLTVINGYSDLLARSLAAGDPKHRSVDAIQMAGQKAASLTNQLLAFSRKAIVQPVVVDLNDAIRDVEKMLGRLIGEDIEIIVKTNPAVAPILIDPSQLDQVIMNLAVNGRDAMPKGGRLTLETFAAVIGEEYIRLHPYAKAGRYSVLALTDTGEGIPPELKERIFEPFFTTKEQGQGTGLGLSTVYGVVQQAGGHIEVYSEIGSGTTFKLYFPEVLANREAEESEKQPQDQHLNGTETVMIVEDEQMVLELADQTLGELGYHTLCAANAAEAQKISDEYKGQVHMLFTDVVMPGMSGPELAKILSEKWPGIKVLFASGYTDDAVVRHGLLEGGTNFLQKPYSTLLLGQRVRGILDQPD